MRLISKPRPSLLTLGSVLLMAFCALSTARASSTSGTLVVYPAPQGEEASKDYEVRANGRSVFVHVAPTLRGGPASFASFDFSGAVDVTVDATTEVRSAKILPSSYRITPRVSGNKVSFTLTKPANLTIELNDSIDRPLHLFANPLETDRPDPAGKDVIYFGPGLHEVTTLQPKSGQTIYLAGGAIVRVKVAPGEKPTCEKDWTGQKVYRTMIETSGAKGLKVCGRGVLDMRELPWHARTAMWFGNSQDVLVEGIIVVDAPAWVVAMQGSSNVVVRNVKQICSRENSDGIDICNSQNVLVEDCFLRNNDDEVCVKTLSPDKVSKNIVVRRCVIWNERARGLGITSETRADISDVLFQDCDIIHDFSNGGDCAALAVLVSDSGTMRDIRFEDIRVEHCAHSLINCWIGADFWGHDKTRGHVEGVTFRNVAVTGDVAPAIRLSGCDPSHRIEDVRFENLQIRGRVIKDANEAKLQMNEHVKGVSFVEKARSAHKSGATN